MSSTSTCEWKKIFLAFIPEKHKCREKNWVDVAKYVALKIEKVYDLHNENHPLLDSSLLKVLKIRIQSWC